MGNPSNLNPESRKRILMGSTNYWNSPFQVGSHHLARGFIKAGWDVVYVSDPISPLHPLAGINEDLKARYKIYKMGGTQDMQGHLWTFVPGSLLPHQNKPLLKTKYVLKNWHKFTFPNAIQQIKNRTFDSFDLLYLDSPLQHFWLDVIRYKKSVFRLADNNRAFSKSTHALEWAEKKIVRKVDTTLYTARTLKDHVESLNPKQSIYFPNGINIENFLAKVTETPNELQNIPKPIAIYVGAMEFWFDFDLINYAAKQLPHVSFVLIGPKELAEKKLEPLPNIHLLGPKPYNTIALYLHQADIGIIPFNTDKFPNLVNFINPLKLYEYFACKLGVVAMEWDELKLLESPALLCNTYDQFTNAITNYLSHGKEESKFISEDNLKRMDWSNRVSDLIEALTL